MTVKKYFKPDKAQTLDQVIISKLIEGSVLGIGLAIGNALALIIEKKYFPGIAREVQQQQKV